MCENSRGLRSFAATVIRAQGIPKAVSRHAPYIVNVATTNNVLRFTITQQPPVDALVYTTPNFLTPMFGTTQA